MEIGLSGKSIPFHVSRNPQESDFASLSVEEREHLKTLTSDGNSIRNDEVATGQTSAIWPLLLMFLIALIAGGIALVRIRLP